MLDAGAVLQVVNTQTGVMSTGITTIPNDDTIPQNTEGAEVMTLAITPKSATSKLKIDVVANLAAATTGNVIAALFQDSTANVLITDTAPYQFAVEAWNIKKAQEIAVAEAAEASRIATEMASVLNSQSNILEENNNAT